jgi:hypothetical protein
LGLLHLSSIKEVDQLATLRGQRVG